MSKHYTTKEQSKRLLKIGISKQTADMVYEDTGWTIVDIPCIRTGRYHGSDIPCWSSGQLVDIYRAARKFLTGKWCTLRVLQEDEINCETIISELEEKYNYIHTHYDCSKENIYEWYDFSKISL